MHLYRSFLAGVFVVGTFLWPFPETHEKAPRSRSVPVTVDGAVWLPDVASEAQESLRLSVIAAAEAEQARRAAEAAEVALMDGFWPLALCEQSGDFTAHGSVYSSTYGTVNALVREHAESPESAQRIVSGTASRWEQTVMVARAILIIGPGSWGAGCVPAARIGYEAALAWTARFVPG